MDEPLTDAELAAIETAVITGDPWPAYEASGRLVAEIRRLRAERAAIRELAGDLVDAYNDRDDLAFEHIHFRLL